MLWAALVCSFRALRVVKCLEQIVQSTPPQSFSCWFRLLFSVNDFPHFPQWNDFTAEPLDRGDADGTWLPEFLTGAEDEHTTDTEGQEDGPERTNPARVRILLVTSIFLIDEYQDFTYLRIKLYNCQSGLMCLQFGKQLETVEITLFDQNIGSNFKQCNGLCPRPRSRRPHLKDADLKVADLNLLELVPVDDRWSSVEISNSIKMIQKLLVIHFLMKLQARKPIFN